MSEQKYQLLVQRGPEPGKVYPLSSVSITVGRDPMAEITITDPEVSRQHVRLTGTLTGYTIQDLGSTNGTFVDGVRLGGEAVELVIGQIITMGAGVALQYQSFAETGEDMPTMLDGAFIPTDFFVDGDGEVDGALDLPQPMQSVPAGFESAEDQAEHYTEDIGESSYHIKHKLDDESISLSYDEATAQDSNLETPDYVQQESDSLAQPTGDPVVIPHQGELETSEPMGEENNWRTPAIIVSLLLIVICCCCGFFLFIYYYGGDWMLRQMGLLP